MPRIDGRRLRTGRADGVVPRRPGLRTQQGRRLRRRGLPAALAGVSLVADALVLLPLVVIARVGRLRQGVVVEEHVDGDGAEQRRVVLQ